MNKDNSKIILEIVCRNKSFFIPKDELLSFCDEDWFLSIMVSADYIENTNNRYEIWEDFNTVISIIESLRYKKLIVIDGVNLEYLEALCDKWCLPDWIFKDIDNKKKNKNVSKVFEYIYNNYIFQCVNCNIGFKMSENRENSCTRHLFKKDPIYQIFPCCGKTDSESFCKSGYHKTNEKMSDVCIDFKNII